MGLLKPDDNFLVLFGRRLPCVAMDVQQITIIVFKSTCAAFVFHNRIRLERQSHLQSWPGYNA